MEELKPCPFCQSIPEIDRKDWRHLTREGECFEQISSRVRVRCPNCGCTKDIAAYARAEMGLPEKTYEEIANKLADDIIRHGWNKREPYVRYQIE